ncbi:hypothetical protein ABZ829_27595 [Streptomyces xanthochromogenes]|uniref:hypothetical protein n=1 Tax=Streptomyces xanthochromogenes TaxID=67384 RepID=UPI0034128BE0
MTSTRTIRLRLSAVLSMAVGMGTGAFVGYDLLGHHVSTLTAYGCAAAVGLGIDNLLTQVTDRAATAVYRCRAEGCTYTVRVAHADAAERRRWQETAAAHPRHELIYPH